MIHSFLLTPPLAAVIFRAYSAIFDSRSSGVGRPTVRTRTFPDRLFVPVVVFDYAAAVITITSEQQPTSIVVTFTEPIEPVTVTPPAVKLNFASA